MSEFCSKCGVETSDSDDLHCRRVFVDEMNKLLSLQDFEKAQALYLSVSFDDVWKEHFLHSKGGSLGRLILNEVKRTKTKQRHRELLTSSGIAYKGVSAISAMKKHRITHCYECKESLDNSSDIECNICGWIICDLGHCDCVRRENQRQLSSVDISI